LVQNPVQGRLSSLAERQARAGLSPPEDRTACPDGGTAPVGFLFSESDLPEEKLMPLAEAVGRFISDGASVALGTGLENGIPFAVGHEIIRQKKRGLELIGPISDMLFDQLIGAGAVEKVKAAWVGNVITGSGYNFRRAVENGRIQVEDHSNLTLVMALRAGAMGVSFMPTRTALGSDLYRTNPGLRVTTCPFTGGRLTAVAAICPDVCAVPVQRADVYGNAHAWGNLGLSREACLASKRVILTAEEIVSPEVIASDPNRVITPGFRVSAVVHEPWGAHPAPMPGFYNRDHRMFIDYRNQSRTAEGYGRWRAEWIDGPGGRSDYLKRLGSERMQALALKTHLLSAPADFGY
jgi:glutaconate CoA-transferase subunit A